MTQLSARFQQAPEEVKRYSLDYSQQLASGEVVTGVVANVTSTTDPAQPLTFVITSIVIAPTGAQVVFYASGGVSGKTYEAQFLATTSINQVFEDVVGYTVQEKV